MLIGGTQRVRTLGDRLDVDQIPGHGLRMASPDEPASDSGSVGLGPLGGDATPAHGDLHIKERRSWKTWQLAVGMIAAGLVGAALNYHTAPASSQAASDAPAYKLPTSTGSTTSTTASGAGQSGASTTTTLVGGSSTTSTTSSSASSPPSTAAAGPAGVLLGPTQLQGNWTSPTFTTTAAGWNIGWAFRCTPAPAAGPSFQVFVTKVGSSPTGTPAISETGPSGQSVTAQSSLGAQTLVVQAPAGCTWAVKVTGS